ncbi:MAG: DUF4405 domain-containing protein [Planctomycetota bacterium]
MSRIDLPLQVSHSEEFESVSEGRPLSAPRQRPAADGRELIGEDLRHSKFGVSKTLVNFWLDAMLMVAFVALSVVSVIVQFVFPPGVNARGWLLWGMSLNHWSGIQFGILAFLGFGIVVHVMLHWAWVCSVVARKLLKRNTIPDAGLQTVYGVALLIGLLLSGAVVVGIATMTIQIPPQ